MPKRSTTESETRKFVYKSFTDRVAGIKIDPIRSQGKKWELNENEESYFITAFDHWRELNLSTNFTIFVEKCYKLCKSLPMIFHNQDEICKLVLEHLEAADALSIEPMTDLVTKFARDLGPDFEKHFPDTLNSIIRIVTLKRAQPELEVIEASFGCLAYLFKYLSRLLVADLIPTFDYLSPLFGRNGKQPVYILRFAAESLSFLIRKSSPESMHSIIDHVFTTLEENSDNTYYIKALATLLSNTLKSSGNNLHSKTPVLLNEMMSCSSSKSQISLTLMADVLVDTLHHTRQDTAGPLYESVVEFLKTCNNPQFNFRILFVISGLRKGDRVTNWEPIYGVLLENVQRKQIDLDAIMAIATILSTADFADTTKYFKKIVDALENPTDLMKVYDIIRQQNSQVFNTFVVGLGIQPLLDQNTSLETLGLFLSKSLGSLPADKVVNINSKEKKQIAQNSTKLSSDFDLFTLWWHFYAFKKVTEFTARTKLLFKVLEYKVDNIGFKGIQSDLVGEVLPTVTLKEKELDQVFSSIGNLEVRKSLFEALIGHVKQVSPDKCQEYAQIIAPYTMSCDDGIRHAAVDLCRSLVPNEILDMCSIIDEIPRDLTNARNIGLRIRNLVAKYTASGSEPLIDEVVPRFIFGLLASRFQPIWKEVLQIMPEIYNKAGERAWDLAFSWIENPPSGSELFANEQILPDIEEDHYYECITLERFQKAVEVINAEFDSPIQSLKAVATGVVNITIFPDLRTLALKSLIQVPKFAEAHGKPLVPYLLGREDTDELSKVAYNDRVTLLELFSKFRKPTKLGRFDEIYATYLYYLSSKHRPLQKLAVACVLSVNTPETDVLRKYRANLEALTDDTQFKDETTTLFAVKGTERENAIHEGDRSIVIPIATRILYGHAKIIKASTGGSKSNQRGSVLAAINNYFEPNHQRLFLSIAIDDVDFSPDIKNISRQQGFLSLLRDYIDELQTNVQDTLDQIVPVLIQIFEAVNAYDENLRSDDDTDIKRGMVKTLRQNSTKCLDKLITLVPNRDIWTQYMDNIFSTLVFPKLDNIGMVNLEQPSALMNFFLTLSDDIELVEFLRVRDGTIIRNLFPALTQAGIKEPVIKLLFGIARNLIDHNCTSLIPLFQDHVIDNFPMLLGISMPPQTMELMVGVLNSLAENASNFTKESLDNIVIAELSIFEKNANLPPNVRVALLETLEKLLSNPLCSTEIIPKAYNTMARLFRQFSDPRIRSNLAACFLAFSSKVPEYRRIGELVVELNSFDKKRLGLPDFDRRLATFEEINERIYEDISPDEWHVLFYNMLFFMKDPEELALRNNAVYTLKRAIFVYGSNKDEAFLEGMKKIFDDIMVPALRYGVRETNETFRELYLELIAAIARDAPEMVPEIGEMSVLMMDGDDEANVFNNLLHIQIHRRQRAVLRLASIAKKGELGSSSISHYLIPLVEHYVHRSSAKTPEINSLSNESIQTVAALARCLTFSQFRAITRRYVNICVNKPLEIKNNIKLVNAVGNAVEAYTHGNQVKQETLSQFSLGEVVNPLHKLMSIKTTNEKNLTERVTIAIPIVLFLKSLAPEEIELELPGKLTWLCQLLRAKSQELRDLVRNTLGKISTILGADYFLFIIKELRSALTRGPQLHILGYTLHSLLVTLQPLLNHGDLDASVGLMAAIIMEDIFGSIGEEKDNENYRTTSKEVKGHKSYDTAFLITENVSLSQLGALIMPVKNFLLYKKLNLKTERKVTDLLRRFSNGLRKNSDCQSQDAVVAMYQLNEMCLKTQKDEEKRTKALDTSDIAMDRKSAMDRAAKESEEFFTVRLSSREWDGYSYGNHKHVGNLHLLQSFVLEGLRVVLSGDGLLNPANIKGLLPIIESGIHSNYEDVQISALKLAALCLKVPLSDANDQALNIGRRALALIKTTSNSSSDLCQACLKLITVILRTVDEFQLKDSAYAYILERIKPDIEEPERQSTTISFIRALLYAKVMIPELYEVMVKVSNVMVTNQDPIIRTSCRSAYLRFLLDYPHGQARLDKYFAFLVSNLEYPSSSGRLSVLEMIRMIVNKVHEDQTNTILTSFFVGLVTVLVNDDDEQCRDAAFKLVESIIEKSDPESLGVMVELCSNWMAHLGHNDSMVRAAFEAAGVMKSVGVLENYPKLSKKLDETVDSILTASQKGSHEESDWQLVYLALKYISRGDDIEEKIDLIESTLLYPHPWVRAISARLFGTYYAECKRTNKVVPQLTSQAKRFIRQLGAPQVPESHGSQIVKNLVYIIQEWLKTDAKLTLKDGTEQECIKYLVHKLSVTARTEINSSEFVGGKQAILQLFATLTQVLDDVSEIAPDCTLALYLLVDQLRPDKQDLKDISQEALDMFSKKLGTTEALKQYNAARQIVEEKRRERRAKRSIEAVTQPELHQKKKLKKNLALRQSRKRKADDRRRDC